MEYFVSLLLIIFLVCLLVRMSRPMHHSDVPWYDDTNYRLPRREPVHVNFTRTASLNLGEEHVIKTLSLNPPVFQVDNFLSPEECNYLIYMAKNAGLAESPLHPDRTEPMPTNRNTFDEWDTNGNGYIEPMEFTYIKGKGDIYLTVQDALDMMQDLNMDKSRDFVIDFGEFMAIGADVIQEHFRWLAEHVDHLKSRTSKQAWLWHYGVHNELLEGFHERLARLTLLPHDLIEMSEPMQVVSYKERGHYHCHHDSDENTKLPCCTHNTEEPECRLCRYLTVQFFLNNVTAGGQTAFQVADNSTFSYEAWAEEAADKCNLKQELCGNSNLVVEPLQGRAIMWYNHEVDSSSGWMGDLDPMTYHGGCDVTTGEKWIANSWINVIGEKGSDESYDGWLKMRHKKDEL